MAAVLPPPLVGLMSSPRAELLDPGRKKRGILEERAKQELDAGVFIYFYFFFAGMRNFFLERENGARDRFNQLFLALSM